MSPRERRLAAITTVIVGIMLAYIGVSRTVGHIKNLDTTIALRQGELRADTVRAATYDRVVQTFSAVAEEHSSQLDEAKIRDRLLAEILRLSMAKIPPASSAATSYTGPKLVNIPSFPEGELEDLGDGYREYRIQLRTDPTRIDNIATFLQRIEESEQLLRVDSLELRRPNPEETSVTANILVTRTLIDYSGIGDEEQAPETAPSSENAGEAASEAPAAP